MRMVNLTPHAVAILDEPGRLLAHWPPSGTVARLSESIQPSPDLVVDGTSVPTEDVTYAPTIVGLPDPQPGTAFLVSRVLAAEVRRADLYFPSREVRDDRGQIIGCRALGQFPPGSADA